MGFKFIDVFTDYTKDGLDGKQSQAAKLSRQSGASFMLEMLKKNKEEAKNIKTESVSKEENTEKLEALLNNFSKASDKFNENKDFNEIPYLISLLYAIGREKGISKEKIDQNLIFR